MSRTVLIIDQQAQLAQALSRFLSDFDVQSDVALDGVDGLSKFAAKSYDIIIMDLHLPKLSGVEVIRKIRSTRHGKGLPIIIITGTYKGEQYAKKAREALAVNHYLEKPFTKADLRAAVEDSLQPPSPSTEQQQVTAPVEKRPAAAASPGTERPPAAPQAPRETPGEQPPAVRVIELAAGPKPVAGIKPAPAVRGNLAEKPMDQLLMEIKRQQSTGILFIRSHHEERAILFLGGHPAGLSTTNPEASFGNHLFSKGKISLMEYQVYQNQPKDGWSPEEIFIKMGCLLPEELFAEWRLFFEETLIHMFSWTEGEYTFQVWPALPSDAPVPAPMNLPHVIHQGYKRHVIDARVENIMQRTGESFIALSPSYFDSQMHLNIEPAEALFLDKVDGAHRLVELLPAEPGEKQEVIRAFGAFLALGMVELRESPEETALEAPFPIRERAVERELVEEEEAAGAEMAAEPVAETAENFEDLIGDLEDTLGGIEQAGPVSAEQQRAEAEQEKPAAEQQEIEEEIKVFHRDMKKKNYYEIFGTRPGQFDFSKLKEEYFRLTKRYSPEKFISSSGDVLSLSEEVLSVLATAYNTLSNVVSKEKYDEMIDTRAGGVPGAKDHDKMQAEVAFQSGMAFLEMGDWDGAEKALGEAVSLAPDNAEILSHYAYSVYNRNRKSKAVQKRVQDMLARALKNKPRCATALAYRGALMLEEDKVSLAEADFKKALSINPRYRFALKGIKRIEARRQEEKKGIFSRLRK